MPLGRSQAADLGIGGKGGSRALIPSIFSLTPENRVLREWFYRRGGASTATIPAIGHEMERVIRMLTGHALAVAEFALCAGLER